MTPTSRWAWRMRREKCLPRYTTRWSELREVKARARPFYFWLPQNSREALLGATFVRVQRLESKDLRHRRWA
ncbi:MAG: DUF4113 domain-containing protein [Opitutaceae bacterium]|nr:DUF4113 domain-containing protein [Opitutaceae bacterium]